MNVGIKLDFDSSTGMATIVQPEKRIPLCLGNNKCKYFEDRTIEPNDGKNLDGWFCNKLKKPVFAIVDGEGCCPLSYWYTWKEGALTEVIIGPEAQREKHKRYKRYNGGKKVA